MTEISLSELSADTGYSIAHLVVLIKRGALPAGRKEGRTRYIPEQEAKRILSRHVPGSLWAGQRRSRRNQANKSNLTPLTLTLEDLL